MTWENKDINRAKDTGLAIVLILLIIEYINLKRPNWLILAAMATLVLAMSWPAVFRPLAKIWFGFSHFLGLFVSKIILSIIFFLIVMPVGLARRAFGTDPMMVKKWKKENTSVLVERNHQYVKEDLEKPY